MIQLQLYHYFPTALALITTIYLTEKLLNGDSFTSLGTYSDAQNSTSSFFVQFLFLILWHQSF